MVYEMTLLYDPECTLCDRFKKTLERIDTKKSFRFVSVLINFIEFQTRESLY